MRYFIQLAAITLASFTVWQAKNNYLLITSWMSNKLNHSLAQSQ